MFKNTFQSGFLSILYSIGSQPLQIWSKTIKNGHCKRVTDPDILSSVLELAGTNVSTNFISCPADPRKTLGIKLPFLVMIMKNLKRYFTFEVTVLDDKGVRRRFRASNYQSTTRVKPFICTMPMRLDEGWNQIQFNLHDFTRRAYGTNYERHYAFRFMQTAVFDESISAIGYIQKRNYRPSSNSFYPSRNSRVVAVRCYAAIGIVRACTTFTARPSTRTFNDLVRTQTPSWIT